MRRPVPIRLRSRSNHHVLAMSPDPSKRREKLTNTATSESDFSFSGLWIAVTANPLARDNEGEHNFLGFAGTLTTVTWSIATNLLLSQQAVGCVLARTISQTPYRPVVRKIMHPTR